MVIITSHPLAILWEAVSLLILIRVIMSWTGARAETNPFTQFVHRFTEPMLAPFRRILPPEQTGGLDFSPVFVLVIGSMVVRFLIGVIG